MNKINSHIVKEPKVNIGEPKRDFTKPANDKSLNKAVKALNKNGIEVFTFDTQEALKKKFFELLPEKSEVMCMSSVTLDTLGISEEISDSGKYDAVKNKLKTLDVRAQRKMGSDADYSIGSVQAITESGEIIIASATGSQLSAYAYASGKVIWIVGTQKIVTGIAQGIERVYEHCFPLENDRAKRVYKVGSRVGKILLINSEIPERLTVLFLKQHIGY